MDEILFGVIGLAVAATGIVACVVTLAAARTRGGRARRAGR